MDNEWRDDEQFRGEVIVSGEKMISPALLATDKDDFDANRLQSLSPAPAPEIKQLNESLNEASLLTPSASVVCFSPSLIPPLSLPPPSLPPLSLDS